MNKYLEKFNFEWDGLDNNLELLCSNTYEGNESKDFVKVKLPSFVASYGLEDNVLIFPKKFVKSNSDKDIEIDYKSCNWIKAADYLSKLEFEKNSIKNNLFSISDKKISDEIYKIAYVNRYLLFLRDLKAYNENRKELIGKVVQPKIYLTHDVDSIKVSFFLKLRQYLNNFSWPKLKYNENLNLIKKITEIENKFKVSSIFFFSGLDKKLNLPLVDPKYKLSDLDETFKHLITNGNQIGLHPGLLSSFFSRILKFEKIRLEHFAKNNISLVRNHWLSIYKNKTWKIQSKNNVLYDFSIGFNNIPGFRNFCSLEYSPIDNLKIIPIIIMDGQFYNYLKTDKEKIMDVIKPYIKEVKNVGGVASINFHQRFFHKFYGYESTYQELLEYLKEEDLL